MGVVDARQTSDGAVGAGTTYRFDIRVMGRQLETTGEVTTFDSPRKSGWNSTSGPLPMSGSAN